MIDETSPAARVVHREGDAPDALFAAVYQRLKAMAATQLAARARGTLDTTALVHELYLRIGDHDELRFGSQAQFFAYAALAMRHLLADRARDRLRQRSGGGWVSVTLKPDDDELAQSSAEETLALDEALTQLERRDARAARVVELRYFAGLSSAETAVALELGERTVERDWRFARAFLHERLGA